MQTLPKIETLRFLTVEDITKIRTNSWTPCFVYSEELLKKYGDMFLQFPHAYGLTVRYAMKASPNIQILRLFHERGIYIDASSGFEVLRAMRAGIPGNHIQLTAQEYPEFLEELLEKGVCFNATSLHQLEEYGKLRPGSEVCIRINPGLGSGGTKRTNVGGPASSFGIWHAYLEEIQNIVQKYKLHVTKIHTHIGSGSDPAIWAKVSNMSLALVEHFPEVHTLNLGGGFKIGRMNYEASADLEKVGNEVRQNFINFFEKTGRKLHLEIEPGTYLVGNSASLVTRIQDISDTGVDGFEFIKIDSGMTEVTRPSFYGAEHPIVVVNAHPQSLGEYIVVGHCCESGDILTPAPSDPNELKPRLLQKPNIGDSLVIEGVGAYCSGFSVKNYNSFPEAMEIMKMQDDTLKIIRNKQTLEQMIQNEI